MREFSIIKKNILYFIDNQNISKYELYQKTGISNGVLSQKGGMSEENTIKFLSYYTNVSADWLLTGKGEMLKKEGLVQQAHNNISSTITQHQTIHAPEDYETLKQENKRLTQENSGLKDKIIQLMEEKISK
jgi:peptidase S24-like protein